MNYHIYQNIHIVRAHGVDCIKFLQSQLTNDLALLNHDNLMQLNGLCNQKGRLIALFFTYFIDEQTLLLALPDNLTDQVLSALRKYAVFSKISFDPCDNHQLVYSNLPAQEGFLFQHSIIVNTKLKEINSKLDYKTVCKENICQQLPYIDIKNSEVFLPAELNLDQFNAISYQKGCFMGQEIIARMKYRGTLKKSLLSLETETALPITDKLQDLELKNVADVVNQVNIDNKSYILAVLKHAVNETPIILNGDIEAKIIA
ncbi:YgfZ/GcvT domain-containing protein [Fastidiosibacter lacustris]|uniref:CAF17-like 4Fe-4S cluster assembly/insertion protein YgfZ n=1 Tax=Fastidiosibacter lacustris TaxID=2056695 RepID=UPI000E3482CF|nr:amino acid transporter [Fastidiosibacter lacustris]